MGAVDETANNVDTPASGAAGEPDLPAVEPNAEAAEAELTVGDQPAFALPATTANPNRTRLTFGTPRGPQGRTSAA